MDKSTTVLLIIATLLLACYLNNETNSKIVLGDIFDILAQNRENLLCDSIEDCSKVSRTNHLEQNWAVWMIRTDSV